MSMGSGLPGHGAACEEWSCCPSLRVWLEMLALLNPSFICLQIAAQVRKAGSQEGPIGEYMQALPPDILEFFNA